MSDLSNYAICYEGIQRVYRNAVVNAARKALQRSFPDDWGNRISRLYGNQWRAMVDDAEEARVAGQLGAPVEDEVDYLGVNHFFNLFEKFFDAVFPTGVAVPDRARQQERQATLNWAKTIQVLRNPISHPSTDDLPFEDAFQALDAARRILLKVDREAAARVSELGDMLRRRPEAPDSPSIDLLSIPSVAGQFTRELAGKREVKDTMIQDVDPENARIYFDGYMYIGGQKMMKAPKHFAPYFTRACETDPRVPEVRQSGISHYSSVEYAVEVSVKDLLDRSIDTAHFCPPPPNREQWSGGLKRIRERSWREKWEKENVNRLYFLAAPVPLQNVIQKHGRLPQIPYGYGTSFERLQNSQRIKDLTL